MKITDEQIEKANFVNLPSFLMRYGFELKKAGTEYVWKVHDSVSIKDNSPSERGKWYRFSTQEGGDNIAFVRKFMDKSFIEAVELLNDEVYDRNFSPEKSDKPESKKVQKSDISIAENADCKRVFAYLCKTRGLDYDMISELVKSGKIVQEQKTGNAVFKVTDENNKVVGAEKVGTSTQKKFKGIATGSASGYGFEILKGNGENLLFFESSIDLLSYLQMKNPDNCRLVSMMGVKPNTVVETMKRYGISPKNVFICSDNDKAGNEFFQRLQTEFPQINRTKPDENFKDWNDMLRKIPMQKETEKMVVYGNKIWNDATDNRDKTLVSMGENEFAKMRDLLNNSGINYFAYAKSGTVIMAINDKDLNWLKQISGNENLSTKKSDVSYIPPQKNIIGNAEYRYIPDKNFISCDRDTALKTAEIMAKNNIQFSGRIYPSGKATLTVSGADLAHVKSIQQSVIDMRKQFAKSEKADEIIGNKAYRDIQNKHFYYSKLSPEQYQKIKPFIDTNVHYSGLIRSGKVTFTVEKEDSAMLLRALENAQREVGIIEKLQENGLDNEKINRLSAIIHRFAVDDIRESLDNFFTSQLDENQFSKMISLVNDYLSQSVSERYGEFSGLNKILDFKNEMDRNSELNEFFAEHNFSDEQKSAISEMFAKDDSVVRLNVIDETFLPEEIYDYYDILHNHIEASDVTVFLENRREMAVEREKVLELTPKEKAFLNGDILPFMSKAVLAWDEIEDLGYRLFEDGYNDKYAPNENASFGNGLKENQLFELSKRMQNGEDIRKDLAVGLLGGQRNFITTHNNEFTAEYGENSITARYGNAERQVSYEELGDAFLSLIKSEYDDIVHGRTVEDLQDNIPDITEETADKLIKAFDSTLTPDWRTNSNAVKNALNDILGDEEKAEKAFISIADMKYNFKVEKEKESPIHFGLLGNGITAYDISRTDKETDDYVTVAHISPEGVVKVYDDSISADDMAKINDEARSAREKFMAEWDSFDTTTQFQRLYDRADTETMLNIGRETLSMEEKIAKYMPFVFFGEGERPQPETEKISNDEIAEHDVENFQKNEDDKMENSTISESQETVDVMEISGDNVDDDVEIGDEKDDIDTPLFTDADVIEEIEKSENSTDNRPFWETPDISGEQLSMFDDSVPLAQKRQSEPKKEKFAEGLFVGNVNRFTALHDEIMRGTGFQNGKFRVKQFYDEKKPANKEFADFLKHEYGIGGHSGDGEILFVDHNSKGMFFTHENGEKFKFTWSDIAEMTAATIEKGEYIEQKNNEKSVTEMTLFHGTTADFDVFKPDYRGAVWTAADFDTAKRFAGEIDESKVLTVKATLENPQHIEVGNGENWDIDSVIHDAKIQNFDSVIIDFKFDKSENSLYQFTLEKFPDTPVNDVLSSIIGAGSIPDSTETIAEFDRRMHENNNIVYSYVAVFDSSKLEILNRTSVAKKSEQLENTVAEEKPETVEIGDKFRNKMTGEISEVISLTGALPWYTDDCTVKRKSGDLEVTENISYEKLLDENLYEYIGRDDVGEKNDISAENSEKIVFEMVGGGKLEFKDNKMETLAEIEMSSGKISYFSDNLSEKDKANIAEKSEKFRPQEKSVETSKNPKRTERGEWTVFTNKNDEGTEYGYIGRLKDETQEMSGKNTELCNDYFSDDVEQFNITFAHSIAEKLNENSITDLTAAREFVSRAIAEREDSLGLERNTSLLDAMDTTEDEIDDERQSLLDSVDKLYNGVFSNSELADLSNDELQEMIDTMEVSGNTDEDFEVDELEKDDSERDSNFTITDDSLGNGGAKSKFKANIEAIKTLKNLEKENRSATDSEKEILSKYVGWGGIPQAFDSQNKSWENEYSQLKELLTPQEYRQANASVLDAFYTSPVVIDGIYQALENFGFEGGNVLEPAMGVGNFFGKMPDEMRENSKLYGVEIDSISGRIAQKLYPDADISIQGFEKNNFQNGCFDVAVGNVPFGDLGFKDELHDTSKLHDFFFTEAIDKIKNGGILAFVTSAGTLDKRDESTRKMLAEKANFIGAVRLPGGKNGAFHDNAGTDVTTDIIFLQKHEGKTITEMSDIPDWVHIGETADGLPINNYFAENPDMVLGKVVEGNKLYGTGTMVVADENSDLSEQLKTAVSKLSATISDEKARDVYAKNADGEQLKIPSNLRNYSFFEQDNKIYFKTANQVCHCRFDTKNSQFQRAKAFINLRDLTRELIEAQELNKPDEVIKNLQSKLTVAYDNFYKKYGLIHSQSNKRYFSDDVSYNLVAGLEKKYDKTKLIEKSDIFTKRTIQPPKAIEHVETAIEALTLSVAEKARVDFEYMSSLTGMTEDELKHDLQGEIFKIPHTENDYQTASEYLSGDIREKLNIAEEVAEYDADFAVNVNALKAAMPEPLKAGDIDVKIGATWLDPKYYEQFMYELFQTPRENRADTTHYSWQRSKLISAEYSEHSGTWHIDNKSADRSVITSQQFGTKKMNAYEIMEHLLNLKEPKVYKTIEVPDPDNWGETKEKRVVDVDATKVVQRKADKIKAEFKKWIFKDSTRREEIVVKYNELFNSVKPREYDGSALKFPMMNTEITLHEHQKNAIAHALFGGNTLFAHSVGAGKTFEMIATAMESKRLGLCTKSLFAVPNHLTEQIGDDFQKLYPSANILVATKKDFQKENRQQLFAKIATGNFDAVIIGHSQLGMIPISKERQEMELQSQIDDIILGIAELKASEGSKFQVKAMERTKKSLEKQLAKLEKSHDDTITFEQLGVDKLFVDEAHECTTRS